MAQIGLGATPLQGALAADPGLVRCLGRDSTIAKAFAGAIAPEATLEPLGAVNKPRLALDQVAAELLARSAG